ncbi:MAG: hypothetical protein QXX30_00750 [Candidatus Aenigmatarchaeota archaeon]
MIENISVLTSMTQPILISISYYEYILTSFDKKSKEYRITKRKMRKLLIDEKVINFFDLLNKLLDSIGKGDLKKGIENYMIDYIYLLINKMPKRIRRELSEVSYNDLIKHYKKIILTIKDNFVRDLLDIIFRIDINKKYITEYLEKESVIKIISSNSYKELLYIQLKASLWLLLYFKYPGKTIKYKKEVYNLIEEGFLKLEELKKYREIRAKKIAEEISRIFENVETSEVVRLIREDREVTI